MWELQDFTEIRRWYALHLILGVTFFVSSLIINAVQIFLYVTLRPFSKSLFRNINYYLLYSILSQILFLAEWWSGSDVKVYADKNDENLWGKEHALIVMNHTYEVDWLMGWIVADRSSVLGSSKVFVKNTIKCVPTIGWGWSVSDVIFLNRNWQKDKEIIDSQIREYWDYPYPVWILLFCEGTRFTYSKHEASMEIARQKGLPELKHHLLPRTKGFVQSVLSLKGHFDAIYDVTVVFNTKEGAEPTLLNMLRGQKVLSEMYCRRLPLKDVPDSEEGASAYLHQLYREKDELFDSYMNTGNFTEQNSYPKFTGRYFKKRYWSLCNMAGWAIFVVSRSLHYYYQILTSGSLFANSVVLVIFLVAYIGLYKMIALTKIDRGSHYGTDAKKSN